MNDHPKLWRDMTPEEKGALLLAHHDGKVIEVEVKTHCWEECFPLFHSDLAYRIRPEPKVEVVRFEFSVQGCVYFSLTGHTHRITFNAIDGKPDTASIKMETL